MQFSVRDGESGLKPVQGRMALFFCACTVKPLWHFESTEWGNYVLHHRVHHLQPCSFTHWIRGPRQKWPMGAG